MQMVSGNPLPYEVAYEGREFIPEDNTPYIEVLDLPSFLEDTWKDIKVGGILQVNLIHPTGTTFHAIRDDIDTCLEYFYPRRVEEFNGQKVSIRKRYFSQPILVDNVYKTPISISYRSIIEG